MILLKEFEYTMKINVCEFFIVLFSFHQNNYNNYPA